MRKILVCLLIFTIFSGVTANSQTRRRSRPKPKPSAAKAAPDKSPADIQTGRTKIVAQIKSLTQFLYLFGGITKGIDSTDQAIRVQNASAVTIEQNERNKAKVKESVRNVREGLDQLESSFRSNPTLRSYFQYVSGVARIGEVAEEQAAANRFDEAGRTLLRAVSQLTDALAAMR